MKRGITLIETVVAVTVLTFALGGPFLLAAKSLRSAAYAREEIAAARLGEEALEIIHNMRDNNSARGLDWVANIVPTCVAVGCSVDFIQQQAGIDDTQTIWKDVALRGCPSISDCSVYQYTDGTYRQMPTPVPAGWRDTGMKRMVTVSSNANKTEYTVTVEVNYPAGTQTRKIFLYDTLMNWFPKLPI
jgi:type II secretory pathway pseudopilin PulG